MMFKINPQSFNAVLACTSKDDVRYYLNSFFVDVTNSKLVATNGHVLATAPLKKVEDDNLTDATPENHGTHGNLQGFLFRRFDKPISNKGDEIYIDCANKMVLYQDGNGRNKQIDLEPVDGRYVDYPRVLYKGDHTEVEQIGFNAEYVAKPARWAGFNCCCAVFDFHGQLNSMGVRYQEKALSEVRITLMPARL